MAAVIPGPRYGGVPRLGGAKRTNDRDHRLNRKLARVMEERDIVKKASAYFAKDMR